MPEKLVPKIGVYTLTSNTDNGIDTFTYYRESEADEAFAKLVHQAYKHWFGKDFEGDPQDAYDKLSEQVGFMDTIDQDGAEFEIPWVTAMYDILQEVSEYLATDQQEQIRDILKNVPLKESVGEA